MLWILLIISAIFDVLILRFQAGSLGCSLLKRPQEKAEKLKLQNILVFGISLSVLAVIWRQKVSLNYVILCNLTWIQVNFRKIILENQTVFYLGFYCLGYSQSLKVSMKLCITCLILIFHRLNNNSRFHFVKSVSILSLLSLF